MGASPPGCPGHLGGGEQRTPTPLHPPTAPPLPQPPCPALHSQVPPCLPAYGVPGLSPSPLHPAPLAPVRREAIDQAPGAAIVPAAGAAAALPRVARKRLPPPPKPGHRGESGGSPAPHHAHPGEGVLAAGSLGAGVDPAVVSWEGGGSEGGMSISVSETRRQRQREVERERDREKEKE